MERPKGEIGNWYTLKSEAQGVDGEMYPNGFTWPCNEIDYLGEPLLPCGIELGKDETYRLSTPKEIAKAKQQTAITKLKECVTKELDEEYEELTDDERLNFDFDVTYSEKISLMYDSLKELQLKKNADYGDSVFLDINVFGESISAKQGVLARIADKIKRLESKDLKVDESKKDTIKDLIGYLVALLIIEQK